LPIRVRKGDRDERHDDVVDETADDLAEAGADDGTDGEVDDVALKGEFLKVFYDGHS
jgi:hypothetical protein